jgi:WD40 repeat protein
MRVRTGLEREDLRDQCAIWSLPDGEQRNVVRGELVGVARDGASFLTYSDERFLAWDSASGRLLSGLPPAEGYAIDQRVFIRREMMEMRLHLLDALDPGSSRVYEVPSIRGYRSVKGTYGVLSATLSPGGERIVLVVAGEAGGHDWALGQVLDAATGKHAYAFEVDRFFFDPRPAFSGAGTFVMPAPRREFRIYDVLSGEVVRHFLLGSFNAVVAFNPCNPHAVAADYFRYGDEGHLHYIQLIDVGPPTPGKRRGRPMLREPAPVDALCFTPDGRRLASLLANRRVHVWDLESRQLELGDLEVKPAGENGLDASQHP